MAEDTACMLVKVNFVAGCLQSDSLALLTRAGYSLSIAEAGCGVYPSLCRMPHRLSTKWKVLLLSSRVRIKKRFLHHFSASHHIFDG